MSDSPQLDASVRLAPVLAGVFVVCCLASVVLPIPPGSRALAAGVCGLGVLVSLGWWLSGALRSASAARHRAFDPIEQKMREERFVREAMQMVRSTEKDHPSR